MSIIIKSTRIKTKSGPTNISRHLLDKIEDNEAIELIKGNRQDMVEAFDSARNKAGKPSKYALRHWIVNSTEKMNDQQFNRTLQALADEFEFNVDDAVVVRHTKEKDTDDKEVSNQHYHITVPEILENGKVLSDKKNYQRHEKIARTLENEFGFTHVVGRHNKAVEIATKDLNPEVSAVAGKLAQEPLPKQKYTPKALQEAKRNDIDIKKLCRIAKNECDGIKNYQEIQEKLQPLGMQIIDGQYKRKDGKLTPVIATENGKFVIGSVASILKMNAKEITDIIEQKENSAINLHLSDMPVSEPVDMLEALNNGPVASIFKNDVENDVQDSVKNRMDMPVSKKSFEDVIKEEQEKLLQVINAPHPDLVEESSMTIKQRIRHEFKNQFDDLKEKKKDVIELKN
ncbi:relaxase/mobilization nuclease domain-containing protein, partial [Acetobacter pomorum]